MITCTRWTECLEKMSFYFSKLYESYKKFVEVNFTFFTKTTSNVAVITTTQDSSRKITTWMNFLAQIITILTIVLSVFAIIGYSYDLYRHGRQKHLIGWFSSGGFVLLTFPISIRLIVKHLTHWNAPNIQKYVVRIIWMIPIYSIESWLALRFRAFALYIETLRECYEAYVIFNFLYFLIALLGDEQQIISKLKRKSAEYGNHTWPINCFVSPWIMGQDLLKNCKIGVLQYVLIKNFVAIIVFILDSKDLYHEGFFHFSQQFYL
jgi:hypothetical protein